MEHRAASQQDPELGQANVVIKNDPKSHPGHEWQDSNALTEPLLPIMQAVVHTGDFQGTGPPYIDIHGNSRNLPRNLAESVGIDRDVWEKLNRDNPAHVLEYMGELDRMLSSVCLHQEQTTAHYQIGRGMLHRVQLLSLVHLLFAGVMCYAYCYGYIDGRPRSTATYLIAAELGLYVYLLFLRMWERYEHDKQAPGEFCFKFDFENLPALRELVGEQKWKDMQMCSDHFRVCEDFNEIICSARQSQTISSPSSQC
ncbi:hypothetical protein KC19_9G138200 [Ceratodon purpureus]|uniref:Uncharacterized protein n=1 Tax=Ceratodon purpureus TaxID=3225 RepID=A0A8T0GV91_CERPU|nr:hypothetical protein KC19_9G138200 [Ceratodon purpureus]